MIFSKRLPIHNLYNIRDLGGYPAEGGITQYGVFIRSNLPEKITPEGLEFLRQYGIRVVLDLRTEEEAAEIRNPLADCAWCIYYRKPAANPGAVFHNPDAWQEAVKNFNWGRAYIDLMESHRPWIRTCLEIMANADGGVLFHCNAGKDRTAILAALVMGIAGTADCDIVADYTLSMAYMPYVYPDYPNRIKQTEKGGRFHGVSPDNMQVLLGYIRRIYGGFDRYTIACGASEDVLVKIRQKFISPL